MTFGQILARGVSAANRSITALILLFVLYGIFQGASLVIGGLMTPNMMAPQPGQPPPPELGLFMAFGCFSCIWMLIMVFGGPWITAGAAGQLRDRIERPGETAGSFVGYGGRFYLQVLVLTLIFVVVVFVMYLIIGLVTMAVLYDEFGFPMMQPQQVREFQLHPVNIALNTLGGLFLAALAIVFCLANVIVVVEYSDAFTALGQAFSFIRRRFVDTAKLWGVTFFLLLIFLGLSWTVQLAGIHSPPILVAMGTGASFYTPYAMLLILAWTVSLWLARKETSEQDIQSDQDVDWEVNEPNNGVGAEEKSDPPIGEFDL